MALGADVSDPSGLRHQGAADLSPIQQGGSIRMPAAFVGIVGLKPTVGLVPYTGIMS